MKKINFLKNNKFTTGFTLVETLVSVSIFSVSVLALLSILAQGISETTYAKQKILASYLAQEGVEYVRNMRDTFVLYDATDAQTGWNSFKNKLSTATCQLSSGCYFGDLNPAAFSNVNQPMAGLTVSACGTSCPKLYYDSVSGVYGYSAGVDSGFTRKIQVTAITADEIKVSSTVSWVQNSGNFSITFSENLFNWIE